MNGWRNRYPISVFSGETKKEIIECIKGIIEDNNKDWIKKIEDAKLPFPNLYGKFVRVERVNNNILEPLKHENPKSSR